MLSVVQATLNELEDVARLFDLYRQFYQQAPDLDKAREFIRERMVAQESVIFVAYQGEGDDKVAVGFTQLYPTFSSVSAQRSFTLNDLYVAAEHRKVGAARALMNKAKEHAQLAGAKGLGLSTAIDNVSAQALYDSLGYRRNETFYQYFLSV